MTSEITKDKALKISQEWIDIADINKNGHITLEDFKEFF